MIQKLSSVGGPGGFCKAGNEVWVEGRFLGKQLADVILLGGG